MKRREFIGGAAGIAAILGAWQPTLAAQTRGPAVNGPVTGGAGRPQGAFRGDLAKLGYVEEEFLIGGEAITYRFLGSPGPDGKWPVEPTGAARPYKTRLLVHRPRDPARFNGTVIVEWLNVSLGRDLFLVPDEPLYEGFAYVGVSAQLVGVHGYPAARESERQGLVQIDRVRYGSLSHPGDNYSFDIFSQVGRLVRNRGSGLDWLGGLDVRKVIATGASQSAGRLRTYVNAIHPRDRVYDAYLPFLDFANATDFGTGVVDRAAPNGGNLSRIPVRYRDDLDVPVMVVNSEQESINLRGERAYLMQPDNERFRLWEVAGAAHVADLAGRTTNSVRVEADGEVHGAQAADGTLPGSHVPTGHCTIAAFYHLQSWITGGPAPPRQPRLRFLEGQKAELIRDSLGIGTGGIRLPEVEAPVEMNTGLTDNPRIRRNYGLSERFPAGTLARLYATQEAFAARYVAAARAAESAGVIRAYRVEEYLAESKVIRLSLGTSRATAGDADR